jgi:predicted DNA-binding transcriptional regulator AlpA
MPTDKKVIPPLPLEGLVNLKQIQAVYPVSKTTLYKEIKNGSFPKQRKKGRSSYWDAREVRRFLQQYGASVAVEK